MPEYYIMDCGSDDCAICPMAFDDDTVAENTVDVHSEVADPELYAADARPIEEVSADA